MRIVLKSIMIGIGVAMDAFAVAMTNGLNFKNLSKFRTFFSALVFAIFQGIMPLIGYFVGTYAIKLLNNFMNVISFFILIILGIKNIYESLKSNRFENEIVNSKLSYNVIFMQAVATSIDALTVGLTLSYFSIKEIILCIFIVALITFVFCILGVFIGKKIGICLKTYAQIFGGLILIIMAITNLF